MNGHEEEDESLIAMLNAGEPYVDDAGFTARVIERLPPRRRSMAWMRIAILLGASGSAALVLLLNRPLCAELGRAFSAMVTRGTPSVSSLSTLPLASMVMLAMLLWAGVTAAARE